MHVRQEIRETWWNRLQTENAVQLVRPVDFTRTRIAFPTPDMRQALGMLELCLIGPETLFDQLLRGDIDARPDEADELAAAITGCSVATSGAPERSSA